MSLRLILGLSLSVMLGGEVEWSTRIFEDRRKTIRYVCEVPTIIEQRVFTLARAIQKALE